MQKAIVLVSGGMDSAVALYMAKKEYECVALIFDYAQKARREIECARKIARKAGCAYHVVKVDLPWKGSSLIDRKKVVPKGPLVPGGKIPSTYVPARNILFLSYGVSCAEAEGAQAVFIGAHQLDFSNYPDCRSVFFKSFRDAVKKGTKAGTEGKAVRIVTPLIDMTKRKIVELGCRLGVPFEYTWSCYEGGKQPCGKCESCRFRVDAFRAAGVKDILVS